MAYNSSLESAERAMNTSRNAASGVGAERSLERAKVYALMAIAEALDTAIKEWGKPTRVIDKDRA